MTRPRRLLTFGMTAAIWVATALPAFAADSGNIDAHVTVAMPCLEIIDPTTDIDFGTLGFSQDAGLIQGQTSIKYANCSAAESRVWAQGTDATGTSATWTLYSALTGSPCTWGPNTYGLSLAGLVLGTTSIELPGTLAGNTDKTSLYYLSMPCAGSDGAGETMNFRVTLTATF